MERASGLPLYDHLALNRWKMVLLPGDPDEALRQEAKAASARAQRLRDQLLLGHQDDISAVRNQAAQLKSEFLAEARSSDRTSARDLKDPQLAFRSAIAGLMTGALEAALALAGQPLSDPLEIPDLDQFGGKEFGSEVFTSPTQSVAQAQRNTPLPPHTEATQQMLDRSLLGSVWRANRMCYRSHAEAMQTSFEGGHSRVVKELTLRSPDQGKEPATASLPRWTVLKYCISDSQMANSVSESLFPLAQGKVNPNLRVVVQHGGLGGAARFEVGDGIRLLENLPDVDMGKASSLQDFLEYGLTRFPSQGYIICALGHGRGPGEMLPDESTGSAMSLSEFGQAVGAASAKLGRKFEVVVSDNCLNGTADMAKELSPSTQFWLSSEDTIDGKSVILSSQKLASLSARLDQGDLNLSELLSLLGEFRHNEQRGVFDLKHYPEFEAAFSRFAKSLGESGLSDVEVLDTGRQSVPALLKEAFRSAPATPTPEARSPEETLRDAGSLLTRFSQLADPRVKESALAALDSLKKMTVANYLPNHIQKRFPEVAGLSVLMPVPELAKGEREISDFARKTGWLEAIERRFPKESERGQV